MNSQNLSKSYISGDIHTLASDNISLKIDVGEFVSIVGPSGGGKSTLLTLLGMMGEASGGSLSILGVDVSSLNERQKSRFRNEKLGYIFQSFNLISDLNVLDNVLLPTAYNSRIKRRSKIELAESLLDKVGLGHRKKHLPSQLSGGQQQKVAIARSLIMEPEIIFADEPTGNLDSASTEQIMEILKDINSQNTTIVMVTHNETLADMTARKISIQDGRIHSDEFIAK
ncbi:ABC transporter ATP-binding protein [Thalassomonas haliotis]|uniref:ABC transporter ATP-binding protein n=1 Tax=Thalassomonas haliotis TaxID=485448 RepID=A0ABY7VMH8_9GAMM|nr:ABC transporter ATP-binding protein [Thalassomonas haliotis]